MLYLEHKNDVSFKGSKEAAALKDELVWIIGTVNHDRIRSVHGIVSPTVFVGCNGLLGTLHLHPNGISDFLSLTIYLKSTDESLPPKFWAYVKCQLLQDKELLASSTAVGTFSWEQNYYVFQNFIRPSDLENRDRLVISCFINVLDCRLNQTEALSTAFDSFREENTEASRAENEFKNEQVHVPVSMSTLYTRPVCRRNCKSLNYLEILSVESSDVTLVSQGQEFPAHRNILASDSTVFSAMFIRRAEENADNRIIIDDVNPDVLHEVLHFIYTRKLLQIELVPGVLVAADKYELEKLKSLCERILVNKTNPNNVCGILLLAERYHIQSLKNWALLFIRAFADVVVQTSGFQVLKSLNKEDLMVEVISALALSFDK